MTSSEYIALATAEPPDDECDIMVAELIPSEELWNDPPPYATCRADHPDRWALFGEVWDALAAKVDYLSIEVGDDEEPKYGILWRRGEGWSSGANLAADTMNLTACTALLLAANVLKEDTE